MTYIADKTYTKEDYNTGPLNLLVVEKDFIIKAMSKTGGSIKQSALLLEISERSLHRKMPRHHIKRKYFLKPKSE